LSLPPFFFSQLHSPNPNHQLTSTPVPPSLSANERRRRQTYRSEVHGQLPFDIKGMDDAVPTVDFSPSSGPESPYALERTDVEDLLRMLDDTLARSTEPNAKRSVQETRGALQKLVDKMDSLEVGFDRIAERSREILLVCLFRLCCFGC
jgi:autophagy-related protein 11